MANRVGGILALVAFAMCLLIGAFQAGNAFSTVVYRALLAMLGTYVVGYLLGLAAERMVAENEVAESKRLSDVPASSDKNQSTGEGLAADGR